MPRPTMHPPGYSYPPMPPRNYSFGYHQHGHPPPPPPQFQNPHMERATSRYGPQFINNCPSFDSHSRPHSHEHAPAAASEMPPPLPSCDVSSKPIKTEEKPRKSSGGKSSKSEGENKKPPRPYTEYNIFFQLERERILMELEKQNREKEGTQPIKEEPPVLNSPSDPNDVLPRPARFAHLKLSPKWYDSTHRLAESKRNKEKRKHRKTHGLVGFLDLTRRIAKEWGEAEEEVKLYCRGVAKRQLGYYKEELKVWKKSQENVVAAAQDKKEAEDVRALKKSPPIVSAPDKMPELPSVASDAKKPSRHPQIIHRSMPPPHYHRNMWQPPPSHHHAMNRNYPAMPALSPSMDYHDDYRYYPQGSIGAVHPLDELMHRRKVYGNRSAPSSRVRKRKTDKAMEKDLISPSGESNLKETPSFLSPEDNVDSPGDNNAAITPSPSSRSSAPQDHLPMKKRHRSTKHSNLTGDDFGISDVSPGSFNSSPGADVKLSPFNFSPSEGMIMTPNGEAFMGQMMGMSPGQWNEGGSFPYIDCFSPKDASSEYRRPSEEYRRHGVTASPYSWHAYGPPPIEMTHQLEESDSEPLDLDDEEIQLMRRLQATRAKKLRQKHYNMAYDHVGKDGDCEGGYPFASPVEKEKK